MDNDFTDNTIWPESKLRDKLRAGDADHPVNIAMMAELARREELSQKERHHGAAMTAAERANKIAVFALIISAIALAVSVCVLIWHKG